jgi:hypothetical protein
MEGKRLTQFLSGTGGGTTEKPMRIESPLVIMFREDKHIVCHIHPPKGWDHKHYGMLVCDLVRHIARAFKVEEDEVWRWVDKERRKPTTEITQNS